MLSVRATLSLVPPPRAPSLRPVSAAGLSDLTRFLITRCGLMVLQIGVGNGQLLENATTPLVADFIYLFRFIYLFIYLFISFHYYLLLTLCYLVLFPIIDTRSTMYYMYMYL